MISGHTLVANARPASTAPKRMETSRMGGTQKSGEAARVWWWCCHGGGGGLWCGEMRMGAATTYIRCRAESNRIELHGECGKQTRTLKRIPGKSLSQRPP